jgi:trigger factor
MNVVLEDISACRKRLKIEVPADRVTAALGGIAKEFQKFAKLPGFRPGKAPIHLVEKKYEKEIEEELKRTLVPEVYQEAIKNKNLNVVSVTQMEDLHFQRGISLSFSALLDLQPDFPLPHYKGLKVTRQETEVTEQEFNETLDTFREQNATYGTAEPRPLVMGDYAVVSYQATLDGQPLAEAQPDSGLLAADNNTWLHLKTDFFLPGAAEGLVGAQPGEKREVAITFPDDFYNEGLRGKTALYTFSIESIQEKILPELTDELTREVAGTDLETFKTRLRENLARKKENDARSTQTRQVIEQLQSALQFELPESTVNEETEQIVYDIVRENQMRGIPDEMLEEKKADIFDAAHTSAKDKVKLRFILRKIAEAEKITVSQQEIVNEITMMSLRYNTPAKKLIKQLKENDTLGLVAEDIRNRKVIDLLLTNAVQE